MFLGFLTKLRSRMENKSQQRDRKYNKVPNRSHRSEVYNNRTEKYNKRIQQMIMQKKGSVNLKTGLL